MSMETLSVVVACLVGGVSGLLFSSAWQWRRRILRQRPRYLVRLGTRRRQVSGKGGKQA